MPRTLEAGGTGTRNSISVFSWPTGLRAYFLLSLLCLAVYLPGLTVIPPLDRDEARFAQATTQMLETGDFVNIRFQDQPRHKKPAGIYWLQAASVALFSEVESREIWIYRLPSALAAWVSVLLCYGIGRRLFGPRTGFLGAAFLAVSLLLVLEAHQAKTDAALLATVLLAQGSLARIYLAARDGERAGLVPALLFWAAQGAGILIKGPILPMVSLATILALLIADRKVRWLAALRPIAGLPLALAIALPWFVAIGASTGGGFVADAVGSDLLPKLLSGQESHGAPPGYFTLLMIVFFWPASLLAWPAIIGAWRERKTPALRFCLAWLLPAWIVFELIPTKLPHYVLPLYPALALITAYGVLAAIEGRGAAYGRWPARTLYVLWAVIGVVLAGAAVAAPILFADGFTAWSLPSIAAAMTAAVLPTLLAWRGRIGAATAAATGCAVLVFAATFHLVMPRLDGFWLSREITRAVAEIDPGRTRPIAAAGYHEPSLVFLLGTRTTLATGQGVAAWLGTREDGLAVVSDREEDKFREAASDLPLALQPLHRLNGFNYSKGDPLEITIYEATQ